MKGVAILVGSWSSRETIVHDFGVSTAISLCNDGMDKV